MTEFNRTCRQCFMEKGLTILLKKDGNGDWICPKNPSHRTADDVQIA